MKTAYTLLGLTLGIALNTQAQNVGINTDGSTPDGDAILHIKNDASSSKDSSVVRIENEQNGANDVTGVEIYNSGTGATAKWDVLIPASGSTDLRISNNGTDRVTIQNDGDVGIGTTSPASGLDVKTSMGYNINTFDASNPVPSTLGNTHNVVLCNDGPYTVNLPAANTCAGRVYYIKNIDVDGDVITIDGNASETIEGSTTYALDSYKHVVQIISDGTNWHVIEEANKNQGGSISDLICGQITNFGVISEGQAATGISSEIPYTGGDGGEYSEISVNSTNITGLTATVSAGNFAIGNGTLTFTITGTASGAGTAIFSINIAGKSCTLTRTVKAVPAGCEGAIISATPCSAVFGATLNDNPSTTDGIEYDWSEASTSGTQNTTTTRALVDVGGQCWMRYNMGVVHTTGSSRFANCANTGRCYDKAAATNGDLSATRPQGICPSGWHVPSDCEFMELEGNLGMHVNEQSLTGSRSGGNVAYKIRPGGSTGLNFPYHSNGYHNTATMCARAYIFTSANIINGNSYQRVITNSSGGVTRQVWNTGNYNSVRCIKD